jgi:hypothetical protein
MDFLLLIILFRILFHSYVNLFHFTEFGGFSFVFGGGEVVRARKRKKGGSCIISFFSSFSILGLTNQPFTKTQSTQSPNPFLTKFQGPAKHKSRPSSPRSEVLEFISSAHKTKECIWNVPEG